MDQLHKVVLIVEDDTLLAKMYESKLRHEGLDVVIAPDGETGLSVALHTKPSLILLDVMMPKLSGIDMLQELRKDAWGHNVPVIILSNLSEKDEGERARELGVKEYLVKASLTPAEIAMKIKSYLGVTSNIS